MKNLLSLLALVAVVFVVSCKDDDDPVTCSNWALEIQAESDALVAAANAYGLDPTSTEKCNAYRTAYQNYLNAAADLEGCANAAGQGAQYAQAIADAQAGLDALQC